MIKYRNPEVLYKLGITHQEDALERFAEDNGFAHTSLKAGYDPYMILSRWVKESTALRIEGAFYRQIKKNFWTDVQYNGVTECRVLTKEESDDIADNLRKRFPVKKYGKENKGKEGYVKVYFVRFTKKKPKKTKEDYMDDSPIDY